MDIIIVETECWNNLLSIKDQIFDNTDRYKINAGEAQLNLPFHIWNFEYFKSIHESGRC